MSVDSRIEDLLLRWEDLREQGKSATPETICQDCPELLDEFQKALGELAWVDGLLEPGQTQDFSLNDGKPPTIPDQLGRYRLDELIGQGGFGQVWRGFDPELDRVVAVKILRPERQGSTFQVAAFLAEAKKVAKLKHPNIVSVHDVGQDQGICYMITELVGGSDLAQAIKFSRISTQEAITIVAKVAKALHFAHENGVIHRDMKPQNILLDEQREPYIADFGIAVTEADLEVKASDSSGTPAYMAPEQFEPGNPAVNRRVDIFSLGVVLYELLVGVNPLEKRNIANHRVDSDLTLITIPDAGHFVQHDAAEFVTKKMVRWLAE